MLLLIGDLNKFVKVQVTSIKNCADFIWCIKEYLYSLYIAENRGIQSVTVFYFFIMIQQSRQQWQYHCKRQKIQQQGYKYHSHCVVFGFIHIFQCIELTPNSRKNIYKYNIYKNYINFYNLLCVWKLFISAQELVSRSMTNSHELSDIFKCFRKQITLQFAK